MKKRFAIMIAGLILLVTPMLASAHDGERFNHGPGYHKQPVAERHQADRYPASQHKWEYRQMKKQIKKHQRMHQREKQHYVRQYRTHYREPDVIAGFPSLIFRIDW